MLTPRRAPVYTAALLASGPFAGGNGATTCVHAQLPQHAVDMAADGGR